MFCIWIFIFKSRKDLRREQLFLSIIGGILAPFLDYVVFYSDYWRPDYVLFKMQLNGVMIGLESPICGFLIAGISGVLYEAVFRKRQLYSRPRTKKAIVSAILMVVLTILLNRIGLNSIWASSISIVVFAIYMIKSDSVLFRDALYSGTLFLIVITLIYLILFLVYPNALSLFWVVDNLTGLHFKKIPIEELIWFFSTGLGVGIFYEFWRNVRKYKNIK